MKHQNITLVAWTAVLAGTCVAQQSTPGTTRPVQPGTTPAQQTPSPAPGQGTQPAPGENARDRDNINRGENSKASNPLQQGENTPRFIRPFALANPQDTARIDQAVERLERREQRMIQSNEATMAQLANLRNMRGDELTGGLLNTLQQLLKDQQDIGEYLVDARGVWTGDMSTPQATTDLNAADNRDNRLGQVLRDNNSGQTAAGSREFRSPFALQPTQDTAAFSERAQQLVEEEERLTAVSKQRLQQLGEVRSMSGERQSQALIDLFQNVLADQQSLAGYLRNSRMMWSGEVDAQQEPDMQADQNDATSPTTPRRSLPGQRTNQPSERPANQPGSPSSPTNPGTTQPAPSNKPR